MEFGKRLAALRKKRGMTQLALSELVGAHVVQIRRYEGGSSQPSLEVIRRLAIALSVSTDELLFDKEERGPAEDFRLEFEALGRLDPAEKHLVREFIEGMLLKHEAKRWINRGHAA